MTKVTFVDPEPTPASFAVEDGIPIPRPRMDGPRIYPFNQMQVGQSFFAPGQSPSARIAAMAWQRRHPGTKFVVRKVEGGYRIWRVT